MSMDLSIEQQLELLTRNASQTHTRAELKTKLEKRTSLRIKLGLDPSSPHLHIGHGIVLDRVADFQKLGHTAVIIIGDYTARIGDPTGRSKTRPALSPEEIKANAQTYQEQVFKIIDPSKTEVVCNSEWFDKMNYGDILKLNAQISVAQLLEREDFKKRYTEGHSITLTEFQYPLMQGYDSVMIRSDLELGGNDQLFNNLVGRDLQRYAGMEPQVVMVMQILTGTDGVQKMSKSLGNSIGMTESPSEIFGKTMSISDETMQNWRNMLGATYQLTHPAPEHPMEAKKELARAIVTRFHGKNAAEEAQKDFELKFSKHDLDHANLPTKKVSKNPIWIVQLLQETGAVASSSEGRRAIEQGAVRLNGERVSDVQAQIQITSNAILQCGKKFFVRLEG